MQERRRKGDDAIYFEHDGPALGQYAAPPMRGKMARRDHDPGAARSTRRLRRRVSGPTEAAVQDALRKLRKEIDGGITSPAPFLLGRRSGGCSAR